MDEYVARRQERERKEKEREDRRMEEWRAYVRWINTIQRKVG